MIYDCVAKYKLNTMIWRIVRYMKERFLIAWRVVQSAARAVPTNPSRHD